MRSFFSSKSFHIPVLAVGLAIDWGLAFLANLGLALSLALPDLTVALDLVDGFVVAVFFGIELSL